MKIRITGTKEELAKAEAYYRSLEKDEGVKYVSISSPYAIRGSSTLYRLYVELEYYDYSLVSFCCLKEYRRYSIMKSKESKVVITLSDSTSFIVDINDFYKIIVMARQRAISLSRFILGYKNTYLNNCFHICNDLLHICNDLRSALARVKGGNV